MIINTNKISIDFKDTDLGKGSSVSVQDAREGSIPHMGIEYTRDCAVQKDMENSIVYTDAKNSRNDVVEQVAENLTGCEFDPADFISKSMTGKDAKTAEDDGTILEEYVAGTLERTIERIKSQRHEQDEAVGRQIQNQEEEREYFEEVEQRVIEASQMAAGIQGISDTSVRYFLENNLPFTPESIHNCGNIVSGSTYRTERATFEEMRPQIEAVVSANGADVSEEKLETAKWLYENDVPVNGDTIRDYEMLRELENMSPEVIYERIVDEVLDGCMPEGADLTMPSRKEASEQLKQLNETDDRALRQVYRTEADFIKAKRQLEETRLSMTIDAARTMAGKGIELDVENLVEIVDELKVMEREAAEKMLVEAGLPADRENIDIAARTLQAGRDILQAPVFVLGATIATAGQSTVEDIAAAGNELRSRQMEAAESYEAVGTEVRKDLGDSISKAFSNVNDILKDLGLPETAANARAVRILGYNRMELTVENILSMKEYDDKVTSLARDLKPAVVTELIRRRENPLEMNLEELSQKVSKISNEITAEDISFRKYVWKLDHSGAITSEERKSMVGIYRLLDKVEKSDGAVIGQVIKDGRELSFSSLLSAVRTRKAKGIDQTVDDEFGALEEVETKSESISDQIGAAFGDHMVQRLKRELSPSVLKHKKDTYLTEPLEVILEECSTAEAAVAEEARYYEERAAEIREMAAEADSEIMQYLKDIEMPDSIVNIHLMKFILEQNGRELLKRYTKQESEQIINSFDDPEELQEVYETIDEAHEVRLEEEKQQPEIHYDEVKELARMASSVSFYRQMRQFQRYEVPIVTEQGVTSCSVTLKKGTSTEKGTVEITVDSFHFGSVQATFKVTGNRVSQFVTSDDEQALGMTKEIMISFEKDLEMNGFTMERGNYAKGRRNSFHLGDRLDEAATNDRLYLVAKLFIQNVQRKEEE